MLLSGNANTGQVLVPLQRPVAGGQAKVSIGTMIPAALINSLMYKVISNLKKLANSFRSSTTFKLKHRIRVCELWLATCIYDVSEATLPPDKSFVLGWPVTNVVATFKSVELKELWLNKLNE